MTYEAPLIDRVVEIEPSFPPTWCVVVCEQGCDESWTVDTADFAPPLTALTVETILTPLLIAHEQEHKRATA